MSLSESVNEEKSTQMNRDNLRHSGQEHTMNSGEWGFSLDKRKAIILHVRVESRADKGKPVDGGEADRRSGEWD